MQEQEKQAKKKEYNYKWRMSHPDYYNEHAKQFYAKNKDAINERRRKNPNSLWSILKRNASKRNLAFEISMEDFSMWWSSQPQVCIYCSIPIERLAIIDKAKKLSKRLSIDRKNNDIGYTIENIALCCMMCNFIKSNLFTFDEMLEIGDKYIKRKWQS